MKASKAATNQAREEVEIVIRRHESESAAKEALTAKARASRGMWADRDPDAFLAESRSGLSKRDKDLDLARLDLR
jgi:hypothetical protein